MACSWSVGMKPEPIKETYDIFQLFTMTFTLPLEYDNVGRDLFMKYISGALRIPSNREAIFTCMSRYRTANTSTSNTRARALRD